MNPLTALLAGSVALMVIGGVALVAALVFLRAHPEVGIA